MSDKILDRYLTRNTQPESDLQLVSDADGTEDLGAFGWMRGARDRAVMLELRKKNGNILAVGYGWIERIELDPSEGITLIAGGQRIKIKGRNLNGEVRPQMRLFQGITRHRVPWLQEADQPGSLQADKTATVIESLEY
jgi:uncharacterized protein YlzI (FlbEa/FlbD family)